MNTHLPYADLAGSAECLDDDRLNKQRADIVQILKSLSEPIPEDGKEHPAIKMWRGNEPFLIQYGMVVCMEWAARGNTDATMKKIRAYQSTFEESSKEPPEWWGTDAFHDAHKANLLRLKPTHYRQFWPEMSDEAPMVWPRSPHRGNSSAEERERSRLHRAAEKARDNLEKMTKKYMEACEAAGINPETFEYDDGAEVVEIGVPDPDVIDL